MKFKPVKCKSGITGSQYKLQDSYANFEEFERYCETYNIHNRLGFKSIIRCWNKNPLIQSSVIPSDFSIVKPKKKKDVIQNKKTTRALQ